MFKRLLSSLLIFTLVISLGWPTSGQGANEPDVTYEVELGPITQEAYDRGVFVRKFNYRGISKDMYGKTEFIFYRGIKFSIPDNAIQDEIDQALKGVGIDFNEEYILSTKVEWRQYNVQPYHTLYVQIFELRNVQPYTIRITKPDGTVRLVKGTLSRFSRFIPTYCQKAGLPSWFHKCHEEYPFPLAGAD